MLIEHSFFLQPLFWFTRLGLSVLYILRDLWHRPDRKFIENENPVLPPPPDRISVSTGKDLPSHRYEFGAATAGKTVYVAGGIFQPSVWLPTKCFEAYNTLTGTWESKPPLPYVVHHPGMTGDGRYIYVVGGCGIRITPLNHTLRYNPKTNKWTELAPLPTRRGALGLAHIKGNLYAVGGADYGKKYNTLECYNISTNTWKTLAPMPTEREHLAVAVANGKLHALGGYNTDRFGALTTHEIYDPDTDTWEAGTPLPLRLCGFAAAAIGSSIFTFGGEQGWAVVPHVLEYDTKTKLWHRHDNLRAARYAAAAAEMDNHIHVLGGNTRMFSNEFSRHHDVFSR